MPPVALIALIASGADAGNGPSVSERLSTLVMVWEEHLVATLNGAKARLVYERCSSGSQAIAFLQVSRPRQEELNDELVSVLEATSAGEHDAAVAPVLQRLPAAFEPARGRSLAGKCKREADALKEELRVFSDGVQRVRKAVKKRALFVAPGRLECLRFLPPPGWKQVQEAEEGSVFWRLISSTPNPAVPEEVRELRVFGRPEDADVSVEDVARPVVSVWYEDLATANALHAKAHRPLDQPVRKKWVTVGLGVRGQLAEVSLKLKDPRHVWYRRMLTVLHRQISYRLVMSYVADISVSDDINSVADALLASIEINCAAP